MQFEEYSKEKGNAKVTPSRLFQKIGAIGLGHAGAEGLNHIFDVMLYPVTVWFLGPVWAGVILIPLSLVWDYGVIKLYGYTSTDWFGFETLRAQITSKTQSFSAKLFRFWLSSLRVILFIFFAWWDPPRAYILVRGRQSLGTRFTTTDWKWFLTANLIGNLIWILMLTEAFEFLRKFF